ncbi:MAG: hypothetical protein FH748_16895 [Balneolaceae bacterium]|nr:hypothetical protein [Balneolaceae bacterium]
MKYPDIFNGTINMMVIITISLLSTLQTQTDVEELIQGTWVSEESSFQDRTVFKEDFTVESYIDNELYKTYTWSIEEGQTPSGLIEHSLTLININDSGDAYHYLIDTLTEERMVLEYMDPVGRISRTAYARQ